MVGKRVQFDDETWEAIVALSRRKGKTFQQLTEEAYADLLNNYKQPVGLMASKQQPRIYRPRLAILEGECHELQEISSFGRIGFASNSVQRRAFARTAATAAR